MKKKKHLAEITLSNQLFKKIGPLIEESKKQVALAVNQHLTLLYWKIGKAINARILKQQRGDYGEEVISTLSAKLTNVYGQGWGKRLLWKCVRTADTFPSYQIVYTLCTLFN